MTFTGGVRFVRVLGIDASIRHRSVVHAGTRGKNLPGAEKFAWVIGRNYRSIKKAGRGTRLSSLELSSFLVALRQFNRPG